jgi:multimeric flavodoxin WrbA
MSSIRLLGISGSPREGATSFIVREALAFAGSTGEIETHFISLKGKEISFCLHCDYCVRTREGCIQKDDISELYPIMESADAWLLATPVYQGTVSAQLKALLDRCRAIVARNPDALKNKVGAAIAVGGDRAGGQEPAMLAVHAFYLANKMLPVSGGPFGSNLGASIWSHDKRAQGAAADEEGLRTMRRTVERLIEVTKLVKRT